MSHRSHRLTQISSLQATVVTMPHSNRYFSARELRIFFGTRIARITRISCLVSKDSCSTLNIILLSRTRISRISRIFFVASNNSDVTALLGTDFSTSPSLLQGELHFLPKPLFLRKQGCNRPTRCSEPLRSKVGGPSKVFAMFCGMGPHGDGGHRQSNEAV